MCVFVALILFLCADEMQEAKLTALKLVENSDKLEHLMKADTHSSPQHTMDLRQDFTDLWQQHEVLSDRFKNLREIA